MDPVKNLVYVGRIIELKAIAGADMIESATVVCGEGGKWQGIVGKNEFSLGGPCLVFMPDCILPEVLSTEFMRRHKYRVKMIRLRGAPSEVVIMSTRKFDYPDYIDFILSNSFMTGLEISRVCGVTKYEKPMPKTMQGKMIDWFPTFIPKTDELHYQKVEEYVKKLEGEAYYITEKMDGSSCTVFRKGEVLHVCSRNVELAEDANVPYWHVANKYGLREKLPENIAVQFEVCGPSIQSNRMGLKELDGFVFSAYNIEKHEYLEYNPLRSLCKDIGMPMCKVLEAGGSFTHTDIQKLGVGEYSTNGKPREGVVVRSMKNLLGSSPVSFKVINLEYEM
jgi:RNA ligase (TIGR02306 family)